MRNAILAALIVSTLPLVWVSFGLDGHVNYIFSRLWPFMAISLIMIVILATPYSNGWVKWLAIPPTLFNVVIFVGLLLG